MNTSQNGDTPHGDPVAEAAELIAQRLEAIDAELEGLEALRDEQRRLVGALRQFAPEHPRAARSAPTSTGRPVGRPRRDRGSGYGNRVHNLRPESLEAIWGWVRARGDEPFTVPDVIAGLDGQVSHEPVRRGVAMLRAAEAVRLVGRGGKTGAAHVLRVLDVEAGDRAVEANAERAGRR